MDRPFPAYSGGEPYLFVSYAHEDETLVYEEIKTLHDQGVNLWYDEGISPGSSWRQELASRLESAAAILFFVTPNSVASAACTKEINFADEHGIPKIIVYLRESMLPTGLELTLSDTQAILKYALSNDEYHEKVTVAIAAQLDRSLPLPQRSSAPVIKKHHYAIAAAVLVVFSILSVSITDEETPEPVPETAPLTAMVDPQLAQSEETPVEDLEPSIAVMPFTNLSDDESQVFFSDGIAEDILNGLTRNSDLKVIARSSSFALRDRNLDVREIGTTLGTNHILEGSVRRLDDRVRVTATLIDARDGSQVWSERFDRELTDIFAVQDDIANAILSALDVQLTGFNTGVSSPPRNVNPIAYNEFLMGRHFFNQGGDGFTTKTLDQAVEHFENAVQIDPEYADAYAWLGRTHNLYLWQALARPQEKHPVVRSNINKALELDPNQVEALGIRAQLRFFVDREYQAALNDFADLLEKYPSNTAILSLAAQPFRVMGRWNQAIHLTERQAELDPLSPFTIGSLALVLWDSGDFNRALELAGRSEALGGNSMFLSVILAKTLGDHELAQERFERYQSAMGPVPPIHMIQSILHSLNEETELARAVVAKYDTSDPFYAVSIPRQITLMVRKGELDAAIELVREGFVQHDYNVLISSAGSAGQRVFWSGIFEHPQFHEIIRENGLDPISIAKLRIPEISF